MKYYSVSEFAKLRGTTAETLRHYDRVGLLSPAHIDPNTGYRYYSIVQYEKLGTILELRELGISLDVIKDFFENRNIGKSKEILKNTYKDVHKQIKTLSNIEKILKSKIEFLEEITQPRLSYVPTIKKLPTRYVLTNGDVVQKESEMSYQWTILEKDLDEISPILATNRIGWLIKQQREVGYKDLKNMPFIFTYEKNDNFVSLHKGEYACIYCVGVENYEKAFNILLEYTKTNGFITEGDVIVFVWADITVTESQEEHSVEMQIKINRKSS